MSIKIEKNLSIKKIIRLKDTNEVYREEINSYFDYYFSSVEPNIEIIDDANQVWLIDFSKPAFHKVKGYDRSLIHFPSMSEPFSTTQEYLEFANLAQGDVVIDLGAYSGLSSIVFKDKVGPAGTVIAVEADPKNFASLNINLKKYLDLTGMKIDTLNAAIWTHNNGIRFSSESTMGSTAADIVQHLGDRGAEHMHIPSITLESILDRFNLARVDFLKVDVEGAENYIFDQTNFFNLVRPRVYIELHRTYGIAWGNVPERLITIFSKYDYSCELIQPKQDAVNLPMLACTPK